MSIYITFHHLILQTVTSKSLFEIRSTVLIQYYNAYCWQDIFEKNGRFVTYYFFSNLFQVNDTTECWREYYSMICCMSVFWQFYSCLMWMSWVCSSLMWTIYNHFTSLMWISHKFLLISISCLVTFIYITFHHQSLYTVISKDTVWNKKYNSHAVLQYILLAGYHWKKMEGLSNFISFLISSMSTIPLSVAENVTQ